MKYKTSITKIENGKEFIRGHALTDLIKEKSFVETIFLILKGELPNQKETKMMNAIFTAAIDHGPGTASGQVSRITASAKSSMNVALAAGILTIGDRHGGAIEGAAKFFQENNGCEDVSVLAKDLKEKKIRVPGFGHAVLTHDERSEALFATAKGLGFYDKNCVFAENFYAELNKISSKELPINIDGSMAAILSDMGFDYRMMKGFFIISRVPGLIAQIYEEITNDEGLRRVSQENIEYIN